MTAIRFKCFLEDIELPNFSYEPIQINVVQSGNYTMSSVDSRLGGIITDSLYKEHYNEFFPYERLIAHNSHDCPNGEFKIITELQANVTYILIMVVYGSVSGSNSLLVSGPNNITFNQISKS